MSARRPLTPRICLLALLLAAGPAGNVAAASGTVTPERLAENIPDTWGGLPRTELRARIGSSGTPSAVAHYDDAEDGRSSRDLTLSIVDTGPYRDATLLVREADAAAGRAQRIEIDGHPGFLATEHGDPRVDAVAGRMWVRAEGFAPLFSLEDLRTAVAGLDLDAIAALSEDPLPESAHPDFGPGALRHFLPEEILGLGRGDGFYARTHPTGAPWGGFRYAGDLDGHEVSMRVTVWDLGDRAEQGRRDMKASAELESVSTDGHTFYVDAEAPTPTAYEWVGRFRLQADATTASALSADRLRTALAQVGQTDRLERLAELVPAPHVARDPLLGQPELADPEELAAALPEQLLSMSRVDVQSEVQSRSHSPWDLSTARARYEMPDGDQSATVTLVDAGVVPEWAREQIAEMDAVSLGDRTVYMRDAQSADAEAMMIVADRLVVDVRVRAGDMVVGEENLASLITGVNLERLQAAIP